MRCEREGARAGVGRSMCVQMELQCQGREQDLWAGTASHQSPLGSAEQEEKGQHSVHGTSL